MKIISLFSLLLCFFPVGSVHGQGEEGIVVGKMDDKTGEPEPSGIEENFHVDLNLDCKFSELSNQEVQYITRALELAFDDANPGHKYSGKGKVRSVEDKGSALSTANDSNLRYSYHHWDMFNKFDISVILWGEPCRFCLYDEYDMSSVAKSKTKKWLKVWAKRFCKTLQQSTFKHLRTANKCKIFQDDETLDSSEEDGWFLKLDS